MCLAGSTPARSATGKLSLLKVHTIWIDSTKEVIAHGIDRQPVGRR